VSGPSADVADRIAAAKLWLVSPSGADLPYLSTALYALCTVPGDRVENMSVDRHWRLYVNRLWVLASDVEVVAAELAHLVWHLLADHAGRAGDVGVDNTTRQRWRTATDITVSEVVTGLDAALPTAVGAGMPPGLAAEEYYSLLRGTEQPEDEESDGSCGSGCDGLARAYEVPPGSNDVPGVPTGVAEGIRRTVAIEFREHQTTRGTMPGKWGRWVADILDPVVPWNQVLHAAVRRGIGWAQGHADYTYTRISRRQHAVGKAVIPALRRPVPAVAVVVDTACSPRRSARWTGSCRPWPCPTAT
jgi:predicted metal-dependent peptidase